MGREVNGAAWLLLADAVEANEKGSHENGCSMTFHSGIQPLSVIQGARPNQLHNAYTWLVD